MRLLIIRGDLQSHSGYAAAARDYAACLRPLFDQVVGVDIHHSPDRPFERFSYPIVSEADCDRLADNAGQALLLSITTPVHYRRIAGALNVGLTFWECDRFPIDPRTGKSTVDHANRMDAVWTPSNHTRCVFLESGVTVPVHVVPWPLRARYACATTLPDGNLHDLDESRFLDRFLSKRQVAARLCVPSHQIRDAGTASFLCVAQDVPRKGLFHLLSEWMEFKRRPESEPYSLILKTTPLNPSTRPADPVLRFWNHVQALKRQLRVCRARVLLWADDLSVDDIDRLHAAAFAHIAPGFGEGFGAPAAAALLLGKPLVAGRHTGLADLLPADYPFAFKTRPGLVRFAEDAIGVYDPLSSWEIPEPLAIADALSRLVTTPTADRQAATERARLSALRWCEPARVQKLMADAIANRMGQADESAQPRGLVGA